MSKLAILGASGHAKVVAEIAELMGFEISLFDDAYPKINKLEKWSVEGTSEDLVKSSQRFVEAFVAIGDNTLRYVKQEMLMSNGFEIPTLKHPNAIVSNYASLRPGTIVMAGAVINPFAQIGAGCIINTSAVVEHDCVISDYVHISPNATLAGAVRVGRETWVGMGSCVKQLVKIGKQSVVGAGSTVISDIAAHSTVIGSPAKVK